MTLQRSLAVGNVKLGESFLTVISDFLSEEMSRITLCDWMNVQTCVLFHALEQVEYFCETAGFVVLSWDIMTRVLRGLWLESCVGPCALLICSLMKLDDFYGFIVMSLLSLWHDANFKALAKLMEIGCSSVSSGSEMSVVLFDCQACWQTSVVLSQRWNIKGHVFSCYRS